MFLIYNPAVTVFLISACMSLLLALLYKTLTNQEELKEVNESLKEINKDFKEAQKKKDQKELMKLQGKMMEINSKKMKNTMKPMFASFMIVIPVFVFLLPALFGDIVVELDDSMNGIIEFNGVEKELKIEQEPLSFSVGGYEKSTEELINIDEGSFAFKDFSPDEGKITFKRIAVKMPFSLPIWGYYIGWLGWYILISVPMGIIFRKALGVVQ